MKTIFAIAVVTLVLYVHNGQAKKDHMHIMHHMQCDGTDLKFSDEDTKAHSECKAKYFTGMGKHHHHHDGDMKMDDNHKNMTGHHNHNHNMTAHFKNMTCMAVCKFQAANIISSDGKMVNKDKIAPMVQATFPASVQNTLVSALTACANSNGKKLAIAADGSCDSYAPLIKCSMEATATACKWEKHGHKG